MKMLITVAVMIIFVVACNSSSSDFTPVNTPDLPQISDAEAMAIMKTYMNRSASSRCQTISRAQSGWTASYEGNGVWIVSYNNYKWRVFEKTASFEVIDRTNCP